MATFPNQAPFHYCGQYLVFPVAVALPGSLLSKWRRALIFHTYSAGNSGNSSLGKIFKNLEYSCTVQMLDKLFLGLAPLQMTGEGLYVHLMTASPNCRTGFKYLCINHFGCWINWTDVSKQRPDPLLITVNEIFFTLITEPPLQKQS